MSESIEINAVEYDAFSTRLVEKLFSRMLKNPDHLMPMR